MLVRLLQSVSFFAVSVSWLVYLLTGKEPNIFVSAMFVTLGALITILGIELSIRTYRLATGGV